MLMGQHEERPLNKICSTEARERDAFPLLFHPTNTRISSNLRLVLTNHAAAIGTAGARDIAARQILSVLFVSKLLRGTE